jgi:hypothetical protein
VTSVAARVGRVRRGGLAPFLELLGLSALAVAQPIFAVFGEGADIFVAYGAGRWQVLAFALLVVFGVPVLLFAVELLVGLVGDRWRLAAHLASVLLLLGALASQVLKRETDLGYNWRSLLTVVIAGAATAAIWRFHITRTFLRYLSVSALAFLVLFLFNTPVRQLVIPSGDVDAADVEVGNPAPVVWLTFDELPLVSLLGPDDRIDPELFPNFAELASDADFYRNDSTVAPVTPEAVPATLTGVYPRDDETLPVAAKLPHNLFTLLGDTYHLNASEGWTHLCPNNLCGPSVASKEGPVGRLLGDARLVWRQRTYPRARTMRLDAHANTFRLRDHQTADFVRSLEEDDEGRPRLDFMHIVLPHVAFEYLPSGQRYVAPGFPQGAFFDGWFDDGVAEAAREQHLLQLQYTDRLLGQVLDRLRELDRYDESLIVVTADHGAAFTKGSSMRGVTEDNFHEIMWTPLLIKAPGQEGARVDDTPAQSIDVLPTVADMLDVRLPWRVDGRVIGRRPPTERDSRKIFDFFQNALQPDDGQFVTVDGEEGFRRVLDAPPVRTQDGDELAVYRHGPYGGLVGRRVDELPGASRVELPGHVDRAGELRDVDVDGDFLPAYQSGEVLMRGPDPTFAVALNGTIAGTSLGYLPGLLPPGALEPGYTDVPRPRRWWTMVVPELFRDGENRIDLYLIEGEPGEERLHPVRFRSGD